MHVRSVVLGLGFVSLALAGVVPQSQSEDLDGSGNAQAVDHSDIKNPTAEHWKPLKNFTHRKDGGKDTKNLTPGDQEYPKHHNHPHHDHKSAKNHSTPHRTEAGSRNKPHNTTDPHEKNKDLGGLRVEEIHIREEQRDENQAKFLNAKPITHSSSVTHKSSTAATVHKPFSLHLPVALPKSSTKPEVHQSSSKSLGHALSIASKSTSVAKAHQPSASKAGTAGNDKRIQPSSTKTTPADRYKNKPLPIPSSTDFEKGPYGPIWDINNVSTTSGHTGDQIDPRQQQLWAQQGATHSRGLPLSANQQIKTPRDVQYSPDEGDSAMENDCQMADNSTSNVDEHPSSETDTKVAREQTLWSRFSSLVKRVAIGTQSNITGVIQMNNFSTTTPVMVFNGQPGMIWLKQKGYITYCDTSDYHNIIGDYHVYVPSIFFTDPYGRTRCNQPSYLFWLSAGGALIANKIQEGTPNMVRVLIAGQCNDCYPWEIQADGTVIATIAGNLSVDWNQGLWGPTLTLGTNDNFYKGATNDL